MVNFWQVVVLLIFYGAFIIGAFIIGYRAGIHKEGLIVEKKLPDAVNLMEDDFDEEEI